MIYLDNAATTQISEPVLEAMMPYLTTQYGNPSSSHSLGRAAQQAVQEAREIIADSINALPEEIFFTSGGSESNNFIIKGYNEGRCGTVITSKIEHHSVTNALKQVKKNPNDILFVDNDKNGLISVSALKNICRWSTDFCSIMMVNNEIGTIQPIQEIGQFCNDKNIFFHCDAVQAFGKLHIDVQKLMLDGMSVSGHKIHGPKGIGFAYISKSKQKEIRPLIIGGQQEQFLRAGTENVAAIVGLGKATEIAMQNIADNCLHVMQLSNVLLSYLSTIPYCHLNCDLKMTDYRHINFRIDGIAAEVMLELLNMQGIYVSSGSACNSSSNNPSHVLLALGLSEQQANESLRVSLDENLTEQDIIKFCKYLEMTIEMIKEK